MLSEYSLKHCWNAIFSRVFYFSSSMQMCLLRLLVIIWVWRVTIVSQPFNLTIVAQNSKTCRCQYATSLLSFLAFLGKLMVPWQTLWKCASTISEPSNLKTGGSNVVRLVHNLCFELDEFWLISILSDSQIALFFVSTVSDIARNIDFQYWRVTWHFISVLKCTLKSIQIIVNSRY